MRDYFATFCIAELFSSDGASIFTSHLFKDFCTRWGINQRISSAYHPRSNKRAEVAVKSAKRLIRDSLGPAGSLNTDALARALLAHRNTPDPITGLSPSQIIFGRKLRDFTPCSPGNYTPREEWRVAAEQRELAMAQRHVKTAEALSKGSKQLAPLIEGDSVSIQDQTGTTPKRWSKTGRILEILGNDSYFVKVDGSQRIIKRNRQFLRKLETFQPDTDTPAMPATYHTPSQAPLPDTTEFIDPVEADADRANAPDIATPGPTTRSAKKPQPEPTHASPPAPQDAVPQAAVPPAAVPQLLPDHGQQPVRHHAHHPSSAGHPAPAPQPTQPHPMMLQAQPHHAGPQRPALRQFSPPPPGVPHYDTLRRLEEESRRHAQVSRELNAYLASILTSQAMSSSAVGGIQSYYTHAQMLPAATYQ